MAKTFTNPFAQTLKSIGFIFLPAVSAQSVDNSGVVSNNQTIYTASAEGGVLKALRIATNDSAARYFSLWMQPGGAGSIILIGTVAVPATSGLSATGILANVDFLANGYVQGLVLDQSNRPVLELQAGSVLSVGIVAALTANKVAWISGDVEDFA